MDPNETLLRLRRIVRNINDDLDSATTAEETMVELFQSLDDWIQAGGFLPTDWEEV